MTNITPENVSAQDATDWLAQLPQNAFSADDLKSLRILLLHAACQRKTELFPAILKAMCTPAYQALPQNDWCVAYCHRILGSLLKSEEMLEALAACVNDGALALHLREQLLLAAIFAYLEHALSQEAILAFLKGLLEGAAEHQVTGQLAMALVMNSAVIGGAKLKKETDALLNSTFFKNCEMLEEHRMILQALPAIQQNPDRFRSIFQKEHLGGFTSLEAELPKLEKPVEEEVREMPKKGTPYVRQEAKISRNAPCPCGSGKKYKNCCGR